MESLFTIEEVQRSKLVEPILDLYTDLYIQRHEELNPKDPPESRTLLKKRITQKDPFWDTFDWIVWDETESKIIGRLYLGTPSPQSPEYVKNKHVMDGYIYISQTHRRKGIATSLLKIAYAKLKEKSCIKLESWIEGLQANPFLESLGIGKQTLDGAENRLYFNEVDWKLMKQWVNDGPQRAEGVRIETFMDVPENLVEDYTKAYTEAINLVPKGEQDWDAVVTPETRRDREQKYKDAGMLWITKISIEPDGTISGMTEIDYSPENPHYVGQELTAVIPKYRGRGLGKWLKADMLIHVKNAYPGVQYVRTGNADENAPMLAINIKMGFKPYKPWITYSISTQELENKFT